MKPLNKGYVTWMRKRSNTAAGCMALASLLPFFSIPVQAAEDWEQFVTERWFRVEVVIFERPQASPLSPEAKSSDWSHLPERWYPARMQALRLAPDEVRRRYPIRGDGCISSDVGSSGRLSEFGDRRRNNPRAQDQKASQKSPTRPKAKIPPEFALLQRQIAELEQGYFESSYRWLSPNTWQLRRQATALERRGGMNVLFHGAWQQPVPKRSEPSPLLFHQGPMIGEHQRLEGTLGVTVGRYLHFHAQLWLHSTGDDYLPPELSPELPQENDPALGSTAERNAIREAEATTSGPAGGGTYVELNESRRMRSGELNYLDHPNFGILVKIEPLDIEVDMASASPSS